MTTAKRRERRAPSLTNSGMHCSSQDAQQNFLAESVCWLARGAPTSGFCLRLSLTHPSPAGSAGRGRILRRVVSLWCDGNLGSAETANVAQKIDKAWLAI